jgi:biotin transport system substrate-specific component
MNESKIRQLVLAGLFTALTVVGAFIKIPFYPVPITLQTLMTALAGLFLIPRWAALSQIVYVMLGLLGAPVFANGGGLDYVLRPTFGYLFLLPFAAALISFLQRRAHSAKFLPMFSNVVLGLLLVLIGGGIWLYLNMRYIAFIDFQFWTAMLSGTILFFPATLFKAFVATIIKHEISKRK